MSLKQKIEKAKQVVDQARTKWSDNQIAVAWTGGKDSTVVLHLIKQMYEEIPFWVMFNDSTIEFEEIYEFINRIKDDWSLRLLWKKHLDSDLQKYEEAETTQEKMVIMRDAKINVINHVQKEKGLKAFISGIRWDEHEARADEEYFSKRKTHIRVHPILHFTIDDIWKYIHQFNVPYVKLYDQGYKSLGEAPFTNPVKDPNAPERAGREATKEKAMQRLRELGYW